MIPERSPTSPPVERGKGVAGSDAATTPRASLL